jgi:hypothetical protein
LDRLSLRRLTAVGLLLAALGSLLHFSHVNRHFELDDALIYHRYVGNFLAGEGLVYNPGELFNALTSPLFSYLSIAGAWLLGDVHTASVVLAALCLGLALAVWTALFARHTAPPFAALGALLAAISPFFYSTFGMETPLFVLLLGVCLYLFESNRTFGLGIAGALLVLTRSEGIFLLAALAVEHFRQRRPLPRVRHFAAPALLVGIVLAFNAFYYGNPLPHTAAAKFAQGRSGLWGDWPLFARIGYHLEWFFGAERALLLGLIAVAVAGLVALRKSHLTRVSLLFLLLLTAFYTLFNIPNYHWYYAPFYLILFFYAGAGVGWLTRRLGAVSRRELRLAGLTTMAVLVGLFIVRSFRITELRLAATTQPPVYRKIGLWMAQTLPPDSRLAAAEVGTLGWHSGLHIIDILGLVTPRNAEFLGQRRFGAWLQHHSPDFVLVHDPIWESESGVVDAVARGEFVRAARFDSSGFKLYRATGLTGASISQRLESLRDGSTAEERVGLAQAILDDGLFEPYPLVAGRIVAVNLTADAWTHGTTPAAVAVRNLEDTPLAVALRIACVAPETDLPLRLFIDAGATRQDYSFDAPGFLEVALASVPPHSEGLFILWTDKAWTPGPHDPRQLGLKLFPPLPDPPDEGSTQRHIRALVPERSTDSDE